MAGQDCTYIIENLGLFHKQRANWHATLLRQVGGKPCDCHLHGQGPQRAADAAHEEEEAAWLHAQALLECADSSSAAEARQRRRRARAPLRLRRSSQLHSSAGGAMMASRHSRSTDALQEALMPCGMDELPGYTVTGQRPFRIYPHACANNRCPKRIFHPKDACGYVNQFSTGCPLERSKDRMSWWGWEQMPRGSNSEGQPRSLLP